MQSAASLTLDGRPDAVPQVRRLVADLPGLPEDLRSDAVLVASELTTNACLHGRPPIQVGISLAHARLRVEVSDVGRSMPVRPQVNQDAMTGRGFALVAAVAQRWGVEPLPSGGKVVWAELGDGGSVAAADPQIDVDALLEMWPEDAPVPASQPTRSTVHLGAVPTELLLEAKSHIDDVVRELTLMSADDGADQLSPAMRRLVAAVTEDFAEARGEIKRQALDAAGRGELMTELTLHLPLAAADAGERYLAALDEIDRQSRAARMLTLAPPRSHQIFRRWYLRALIDQLRTLGRGETPSPPRPFSQVLAGAVDELAALLELQRRLELLQDITAELAAAGTVEEMAAIVVERALDHAGIAGARVYTLTERDTLRLVAAEGSPAVPAEADEEIPLAADLPAAEVVRTGQPLHERSLAQLYDRFPTAAGSQRFPYDSSVHHVPLTIAGHVIGLLVLSFRPGEVADEAQPSFVRSMADVLAQAIERSHAVGRVDAERQRELALLTAQREALASVIAGKPLTEVLDHLVVAMETVSLDGMLGSVLLVSEDGTQLRHVSAPSLPAERNAAIDGIGIGPVHSGVHVGQDDGQRWVEYPELALRAGAASCWVTPVADKEGSLRGAFAVYYRRPGRPSDADLSVVGVMVATVALIVERSQSLSGARAVSLQDEAAQRLAVEVAVTAGGVGTFDWNLVTGELVWDERLFEIFGFDADRRGVLDISDFFAAVHPGDRDRVSVLLRQAVDDVGEYDAEYRVQLPGGETRWVAARGKALAGPDGSTTRLLGAAQDTTVRRAAEARVARAMDSLSTAFFFLDRDWRFTFLNAEAERILLRQRADLLARSIWDEFPASVGSEFETYYRHAARAGEPVAFEAYYPEPLNSWYEVRAWPNPDGLAVYFLDITDRRQAQESAQRAINRAGLLARVTEELAETLDAQQAMRRLAEMVVPMLADWCVVTLINDESQVGNHRGLEHAAGHHADPAKRALVEHYATTRLDQMSDHALIERAVDTAEPQVHNRDAMVALREVFPERSEPVRILEELDTYAIAVLPLLGHRAPVGMLSLVNTSRRGSFSAEDLDLMRDIAARAGLVLDRGRLYRQQRDVAEGLQRSLLKPPPAGTGRQIAVRYVPAAEVAQVGGDWYDAFDQPDGSTVLVIGDVMGHDLLAAAAMGEARMLVRTLAAQSAGDPARVVREAERVMQALRLDTLATVLVARLEPRRSGESGRRLRFCNAGHPPPIVLSPDGTVAVLDGEHASPLLGVGELTRAERQVELEAGATVVLFTDGLVERRSQPIEEGINRLVATLAAAGVPDPERLCDTVLAELMPERPEDDVALLAVRI